MPTPQKCPACNSENIAYFLFGMPIFDEKLKRNLEDGKVVLGGCGISRENPEWHCNDCKFNWSKSSVNTTKN